MTEQKLDEVNALALRLHTIVSRAGNAADPFDPTYNLGICVASLMSLYLAALTHGPNCNMRRAFASLAEQLMTFADAADPDEHSDGDKPEPVPFIADLPEAELLN